MILYGIALVLFLLGLAVTLFAYVSAHRTVLPQIPGAIYLWWPGLGLVALSGLVVVTPSMLAYQECQQVCDVLDGRPTTHPAARNVAKEFESCVGSGVSEVRRAVVERMKDGATGLDPDRAAAEAEPGIREVCAGMATSQCIAVCYRPHASEREPAAAGAGP